MDILKTAIEWTRAEMVSSAFFVLFGLGFLLASAGFWQLGKTDVAKAYVVPMLIAGILLALLGVGLFVQSQGRVSGFADAYSADARGFIGGEIERAEKVLNEYRIAVFRVIPLIVAVAAFLILLIEGPVWQARLITAIIFLGIIMVVDTNASARLAIYKDKLMQAQQ